MVVAVVVVVGARAGAGRESKTVLVKRGENARALQRRARARTYWSSGSTVGGENSTYMYLSVSAKKNVW